MKGRNIYVTIQWAQESSSLSNERAKNPFREWIGSLKDESVKRHLLIRIDRLSDGNPGSHRSVGDGVVELKINTGPGYRIYLGQYGEDLIILLCGGDKSTQENDIKLAKAYWADFRRRQ